MPNNEFNCDCKAINEKLVNEVKEKMLTEESYAKVADFFKLLGDVTRCKMIAALAVNEMCVGDLSNVLNMTKSAISHQLSKMKEIGVVKSRKSGKEVYYSLDDEHVENIFKMTIEHVNHTRNS